MFFLIVRILMKFKELKSPFLITGIKHTRGHVTNLIHLSRMWAVDYFSLLPRRLRSDVSRKCEWKGQEFFGEKILICLLLTRLPFPDDSFAPAKVNTWNGGDRGLEVSVIKKNMLHSSASSWGSFNKRTTTASICKSVVVLWLDRQTVAVTQAC